MKRKWALLLVTGLSVFLAEIGLRTDASYVLLTGFSRAELEQLSYLPEEELHARIGLAAFPGGFTGALDYRGRAAHAIASYLGTRRWGPDVTLACGYLREYVPFLLHGKEADPVDIAANYAGVALALSEIEKSRSR